MRDTFRQSMTWLHTWAGVVLGALLFAIFWMGTLSLFDHEIDRWMLPDTRLVPPAEVHLDVLAPALDVLAQGGRQWSLRLPTAREPVGQLFYQDADGDFHRRFVDFAAVEVLPEQGSHAGIGFIFPFHYRLHLSWKNLGYWLVGLAGMAMLVLLVSGVIIHKKIFQEFFGLVKK